MASKKRDHRWDWTPEKPALTAILNDKFSHRRAESTFGVPKRNGKLSGKRWNDNVNKDGMTT